MNIKRWFTEIAILSLLFAGIGYAANEMNFPNGIISNTVTVEGDSIIIETTQSPASNAACTAGEIAWDATYLYLCTATGVWKRTAALTGAY